MSFIPSGFGAGGSSGAFAGLELKAEASISPIVPDGENSSTANYLWFGRPVTIPSTEDWYFISAVGILNGSTVSGTIKAGVAIIDTWAPVDTELQIIAASANVTQVGATVEQRIPMLGSFLIRGGSDVFPFMSQPLTDTSQETEDLVIGSQNGVKTGTVPNANVRMGLINADAWGATTREKAFRVYYIGVGNA